ncbi:hypothetical protein FDA33_02850 [Clostridium botulinum]|nr:hypothetical protein [Clostridium botulinum]NFI17049.1 hypothetical protein [Clostridium botulinum]NFI53068.1 hypothetical protein [Clostridium botulinum]NFN51286.1 hypothetical protein [Clostridium botulinum]NFO61478.1 hypothetical protein [Clostridium botulinum]
MHIPICAEVNPFLYGVLSVFPSYFVNILLPLVFKSVIYEFVLFIFVIKSSKYFSCLASATNPSSVVLL